MLHPSAPSPTALRAGSHIYIYRNLRPYYKFVLPPENVNTEEQDIWCVGDKRVWGFAGEVQCI